jgi:hypothetical protein
LNQGRQPEPEINTIAFDQQMAEIGSGFLPPVENGQLDYIR